MSQEVSYYCDDCQTHINTCACPIVVYLVAGHTRGGGEVDADAIHPGLRSLLSRDTPRVEWCAECAPKALARILSTLPATGEAGNPAIAETPAET